MATCADWPFIEILVNSGLPLPPPFPVGVSLLPGVDDVEAELPPLP